MLINSAIVRTSFIVKSTHATLPKTFESDIERSVKKGGAIQSALEPLLTSTAEKDVYATIKTLRATYQKAKVAAMQAKTEGKVEDAARIYHDEFVPSAKVYESRVLGFLALQRKSIDAIGADIAQNYRLSIMLMQLLCALMVALGAVCAFLISRSNTRPLRDAMQVAQTVASGDLTSPIDVTRTDETGQLLAASKNISPSAKYPSIIQGSLAGHKLSTYNSWR